MNEELKFTDKEIDDLIKQVSEEKQWFDNLYNKTKSKIEELLNTKLTKDYGFDDRYALPDGMVFTYKMFIDLCMYYDFIEDLNDKYGTTSLLELRKKLGIM